MFCYFPGGLEKGRAHATVPILRGGGWTVNPGSLSRPRLLRSRLCALREARRAWPSAGRATSREEGRPGDTNDRGINA